MSQNSKNLFYIHDENLTATNNYYIPAEYADLSERAQGFVAGTTISSKTMNTALRQASIFSVAVVDALLDSYTSFSGNVSPVSSLDDLKTFVLNGLKSVKVNSALSSDTAGAVTYPLTLTFNGTDVTYNGSTSKSVTFYAPTGSGSQYQVLLSMGQNNAPIWVNQSTLTVGEAGKVSSALTITMNNSVVSFNGSSAKSLTFYAPTTAGTAGYLLKSNGPGSAPTWIVRSDVYVGYATKLTTSVGGSTRNVGSTNKPIYFSDGAPVQTGLEFGGKGWAQHQDNISGSTNYILGWSDRDITAGFETALYETTSDGKCPWDTSKSVWMQTWYERIGNIYIVNCYFYLSGTSIIKEDYGIRVNLKSLMNGRAGSVIFSDVKVLSYQVTLVKTDTANLAPRICTNFDRNNGYIYIGLDDAGVFQGAMVTAYVTAS